MRFHGLVLLAVLGLSETVFSQEGSDASSETFFPPAPRASEEEKGEPQPLPMPLPATSTEASSNAPGNIDEEIKLFRNELREFQSLRQDVARSAKSAEVDADRVSMLQRQELMTLLTKMAKKSVVRKPRTPVAVAPVVLEPEEIPAPPMKSVPPLFPAAAPALPSDLKLPDVSVDIADPFALGKLLFRSGDFVGAERAFRKASVAPENEMTIKYLLATCLRRQSRWQPALDAYKVVAESNKDPVLGEMARWQISNIRWMQESESQLEKMRKEREKRSEVSAGQSANLDRGKQ